jgi:hypothetical protein
MLRAYKGDRPPEELLEHLVTCTNTQAIGYFNSLAILPKIVRNLRKKHPKYQNHFAVTVINTFHAEALALNEGFYQEQYVHRGHMRNLFGMTYAFAAEDIIRLTTFTRWTFKEELCRQAIRYLERMHEIDKVESGGETIYSVLRLANAHARLGELVTDSQEKTEVLKKSLAQFNLIIQNGWNIFARPIAAAAIVCYHLGNLAPTQEQQEAYFAHSLELFEIAQKKAEAEGKQLPGHMESIYQEVRASVPKS